MVVRGFGCYIRTMATQIKQPDTDDDEEFDAFLEAAILHDDNAFAPHFAAGHPVYLRDADTPPGHVVKQFPDGRRELIGFDSVGNEIQVPQAA